MTLLTQATTIEEAFHTLDPFALVKPGDPLYADFEPVLPYEHYGVTAKLERFFRPLHAHLGWQHIGIVGHKGTGKTTLVRRATNELRSLGLLPIHVNALLTFDQGNLEFADVMLVIAQSVIGCLAEQDIALPSSLVDDVERWFAEELLEETHSKQIRGAVEASVGAGNRLALLTAFTAKVTAALLTDNDYRQVIRRRTERDPRELVRRVNHLLDGAHAALAERKQQLCVVFDELEKLALRGQVDHAVLRHADDFRLVRCHLILFFSPADNYSPLGVQAGQAFSLVNVPVLPVRFQGDPPEQVRPEARKAVELLLDARMMLGNVLADVDACVTALARLSGGHVRDLLTLARYAGEFAEPNKMTVSNIEKAARRLAAERSVLLRPQDWPRLAEIGETHTVENRPEDSHLIVHSCVLNYDGEPWWDIHPLLRADKRLVRA